MCCILDDDNVLGTESGERAPAEGAEDSKAAIHRRSKGLEHVCDENAGERKQRS